MVYIVSKMVYIVSKWNNNQKNDVLGNGEFC